MRRTLVIMVLVAACGCDASASGDDAGARDAGAFDAGDAGTHDGGLTELDAGSDAGPAPVTPDAVLARLGDCVRIGGDYANNSGEAETIPVCGDGSVVWWESDMDIDCDGGREASCMADPWYQPETSGTDSSGDPLDANTLPFIVVPLPSARFRYADHGIAIGQVALVIYEGRMAYAIFGDAGPSGSIGEGSYALAEELGIDPDPVRGGADSGVTFVIFTGAAARVTRNEDHDEAVRMGEALARDFLAATP